MNRCPVEILDIIFKLACSDGGKTGCALSLVSRSMRSITHPFRFHSVALITKRSLMFFSDYLQKQEHFSPVRHLFIHVPVPYENTHRKVWQTLLPTIAPTLRSLTLHDTMFRFSTGVSTPLQFPHLVTLSLPSMTSLQFTESKDMFPSLRKLHISRCSRPYTTDITIGVWTNVACWAPSITHLRLSDIWQESVGLLLDATIRDISNVKQFAPAIEAAKAQLKGMGQNSYDVLAIMMGSEPQPELLFSQLQHVILQPWFPDKWWRQFIEDLRHARDPHHSQINLEIRHGEYSRQLYALPWKAYHGKEEVIKEWLDLVQGGEGFWSGRSRSVA